jgi:hypothetical protein
MLVNQKPPYWRSGGYRLATAAPTTRLEVCRRSRGSLGSFARYPRSNRNPAHHQARIHGDGRRISPDLGSGTGIPYEAQFKHALLQVDTSRKIADSPVLRDNPAISPRNVFDGERTRPRIYKIKNSRDTNLFFGRILPVKNRPE